jgi:hypothetical protein
MKLVERCQFFGRERRSQAVISGVVLIVEPHADQFASDVYVRHITLVSELLFVRGQKLEKVSDILPKVCRLDHVIPRLTLQVTHARASVH